MSDTSGLPSRRQSLRGMDLDGIAVELSFSISNQLYRCPGCGMSIDVGAEHVLVKHQQVDADGSHQHWHAECIRAQLLPTLRAVSTVPADNRSKPTRGQRRAEALKRRRQR